MASLTGWLVDLATRREREYEELLLELAQTPRTPRPSSAESRSEVDSWPGIDTRPGGEGRAEDDGWLISSLDLRYGLRVTETPIDTLPGELRDALQPRRR